MAQKKKVGDGGGKKFLLGAVVGVVAGAVTALLTAPKSGKETRAVIKEKATDLGQDALRDARKLEGELNKRISESKKALPHLTGEAKTELETLLKGAVTAKGRALKAIDSLKKGGKTKLDETLVKELETVISNLEEVERKVSKAPKAKHSK
ncbi:MAG TPA: YtxH domain-containing protein [Candidatus Saccharimonadales bacterium]|nr:YtxH domain-containing protein [Candidatus Saccharimonadales bacterium]